MKKMIESALTTAATFVLLVASARSLSGPAGSTAPLECRFWTSPPLPPNERFDPKCSRSFRPVTLGAAAERRLGFISLIHINADGGDGGNLATASTVSSAT